MSASTTQRVAPVLVILTLGSLIVLGRLFEIQVHEHRVWAEEAARLVHSGREVPYRRGRILDARGRVLARDKDTHHLVLTYRDFRRGHPLGEVAHARSLLEGRPVPLPEAAAHLEDWALELLRLSPRELAGFGRGEGLSTASLDLAPLAEEGRRRRARELSLASRARDVGYYLRRLLPLDRRERRALEKIAREGESLESYLTLASRMLGYDEDGVELEDEVRARISGTMQRLGRMAEFLEWDEKLLAHRTPISLLIGELEETRRWVEDATAAKLFSEAAGFQAGRLEPDVLLERIDLSWIARELGWNRTRLEEWARSTRRSWLSGWRDGYALPRLLAELRLGPARKAGPEVYLAHLASLFLEGDAVERSISGDGPTLRECVAEDGPRTAVLGGLAHLFGERIDRPGRAVLSIQSPSFREAYASLSERFEADRADLAAQRLAADRLSDEVRQTQRLETIERVAKARRAEHWILVDLAFPGEAEVPSDGAPAAGLGRRVMALLESNLWSAPEETREITRRLADRWDARVQEVARERLDERIAASDPADLVDGRLSIPAELRGRAEERAEFFLKDYGRRLRPLLAGEPSFEVLQFLVNYEEDFAGFRAREAREREYPVVPGDEARVAPGIIGGVSSIGVEDVLSQLAAARRLRELKALPEKTEAESEELRRLVASVYLTDEVKGVSGIEAYWDQELTGRNGYYESRGLEDVFGEGRDDTEFSRPVDGEDVVLTLDTDLQRAARRALESGAGLEDPRSDPGWYRNPVGAAVLLSVDGDVLAAASVPSPASYIAPDAPEQRKLIIDRTFRRPTFQPPGSVMKPFVATYALSDVHVDPNLPVLCADIGGGAGYVDVHCHSRVGHGEVTMERAIVVSCNSYFAWLGETLEERDLRAMMHTFGFDVPTGVRTPPPWDDGLRERGGFVEHVGGLRPERYGRIGAHGRRLAGNGLGLVNLTPMQLARGVLALATGRLHDLRLVKRIGERELPLGRSTDLGVSSDALAFVRRAMGEVANSDDWQRTGKVLGAAHLGFPVAVKTGSADLASAKRLFHGRMVVPKHTWIAGWAPADDPKVVFVVFVHDTLATSSHGAVYLARELLLEPEVISYLAEQGVDISTVPARSIGGIGR
ncbi:MAG TPA: hypothetical protein ENJ09_11685 [Planctomycetes bacterium]|nr:hypothetical protein [Planctomycetota bacterium]